MRVGIDGLHLFGNYAGIKGSLANLIGALRKHFAQDEIILFVPRDFQGPPNALDDAGLVIRRAWFPGHWRAIRALWRNLRLQSKCYDAGCHVFHGPTYALPSLMSLPSVVTIHDVIAFTHPLFCAPGSARAQKRVIPRSVQIARRIITPSLAAKEALLRTVQQASADRIDIIPWGVAEDFKPLPQADRARWRQTLGLPEQYALFVSNLEPKKNIPHLIRAFFAAKIHLKLPHKLILAGQVGWRVKGLNKLIRELNAQEYIYFTGYIPQASLPALYSLADLFIMPSLVEGFGLPALEAMACGCPVVISSDPALQEVCGGAAQVTHYDAEKPLHPLREAIEDLLIKNPARRAMMIQRGLERARLFTWEKTARLTHQSYLRALE